LLLTAFLRTILIYVIVLLLMRLMGKREVGQLSNFDLVVAIMIAEIAVFPMQELHKPLYLGLIPIFVLVGAEIFLSYLCLHSSTLRRLIDGCPSVLISKGKIMEKEMRRQRYNLSDLLMQLRQKNIFNIADVEYAILEISGELSVMVKNSKRPPTAEDLNIIPSKEDLAVPLVLDGEVLKENLEYLGLSLNWLVEELKKYGLEAKNVLFASLDSQGKLYLSVKNNNN